LEIVKCFKGLCSCPSPAISTSSLIIDRVDGFARPVHVTGNILLYQGGKDAGILLDESLVEIDLNGYTSHSKID